MRWVLLGGIVVLALAVRLPGVDDHLSDAEGYSWLVASAHGWGAFLHRLAAYENTPPLFYLLLRPFPLHSEFWVRWPSLIASTATVPVLYAVVRPLLGTRAALLAALGLAVAPYDVSFADYSRGFMLAGLGCMLALWAAGCLATGGRRRWWWLYAGGAMLALYSEFDAGLFLAALVGALLIMGVPRRREVLIFGLAPALTLLAWVHQIERSIDARDVTKAAPVYPNPSLRSLRDVLVTVVSGEHGAAHSGALRSVQFLVLAGALAGSVWLLVRAARTDPGARAATWLIAGTGGAVLVAHAIVHLLGPDIFFQRYLTVEIPLVAALLAAGVSLAPWRWAVPVAAVALVGLGIGVFVQRSGRELEPNPRVLAPALRAAGPRQLLTNSATVAFYLRHLHPRLDWPFGLGTRADVRCRPHCPPLAAIDDVRVAGGARPGPGRRLRRGPFVLLLRPAARVP